MNELDKIPEDLVLNAVASSHIDLLDYDVIVLTRNSRYFVGVLSSFDQFGSLLLRNASERILFKNMYYDKPMGVVLVRCDSITFCGERDDSIGEMIPVSYEQVQAARAAWEETHPSTLSLASWPHIDA